MQESAQSTMAVDWRLWELDELLLKHFPIAEVWCLDFLLPDSRLNVPLI